MKFIFDDTIYACYHPESDTTGYSTSDSRNKTVKKVSAFKNCISQQSYIEWYNEHINKTSSSIDVNSNGGNNRV